MEMRRFWGRWPAARATISSVPPAMGVRPGADARASRAAERVGGAMRSYSATFERIRQLIVDS
jgi:hypothetical protein